MNTFPARSFCFALALSLSLAACQHDTPIGADDAATGDAPTADAPRDVPSSDVPSSDVPPSDVPPSDIPRPDVPDQPRDVPADGPNCVEGASTSDIFSEAAARGICAMSGPRCVVCVQTVDERGTPLAWVARGVDPGCPCPAPRVRPTDAGADVPSADVPPADVTSADVPAGSFTCAATTCNPATQLCGQPRPPGICPRPDAGICPQGCPGCPPLPPPVCEAIPAACASAPTCACLLQARCGSPTAGLCTGTAATGFTVGCQGI